MSGLTSCLIAGAKVHLTNSAVHWRRRCINDTSSEDEENTPPNIQPSQQYGRGSKRRGEGVSDSASATDTATPPWLPPQVQGSNEPAAKPGVNVCARVAADAQPPVRQPHHVVVGAPGAAATIASAPGNAQCASASSRGPSCAS
ncbi:hypothetical protein PR003_g3359 [Phytophthora rubi]|uniref:Uncharacterized protein n=1 Tax=Phytophthora rubi TaxID=129364 RepID=A0A6A3NLC8_9STRA|nr:hypothetical protein PR001_g25255 [Phytophthora rubi]KAE9046154.1 hypothetical protein PR002_g1794 [Phytophthora rubi]KAE9354395.1 hypothetical protein PR003_g3359 [Phytophthora rubi]